MKLTKNSKPRKLTLGQVWKLYLLDEGKETGEFIATSLDAYYTKKDRESLGVFERLKKYEDVKPLYTSFSNLVKGMVGNG